MVPDCSENELKSRFDPRGMPFSRGFGPRQHASLAGGVSQARRTQGCADQIENDCEQQLRAAQHNTGTE